MKKWFVYLGAFSLLTLMTSCQSRSTAAMWENTKTASRYFGRGLKVLAGGGGDSRLIHYPYEFQGPEDESYIALCDDEDEEGVDQSYAKLTSYPLAKETPGEFDSFLPGLEGFYDPGKGEKQIFQLVHFDTNRDQVKGSADYQTIKEIAKYLKKNPNYYVYILGHCDSRGTDIYNMSLGSRRSNTIRNLLIDEGVNLNRLFTISYGSEKPINPGNNPKAWSENRRVEFKLYKKK